MIRRYSVTTFAAIANYNGTRNRLDYGLVGVRLTRKRSVDKALGQFRDPTSGLNGTFGHLATDWGSFPKQTPDFATCEIGDSFKDQPCILLRI